MDCNYSAGHKRSNDKESLGKEPNPRQAGQGRLFCRRDSGAGLECGEGGPQGWHSAGGDSMGLGTLAEQQEGPVLWQQLGERGGVSWVRVGVRFIGQGKEFEFHSKCQKKTLKDLKNLIYVFKKSILSAL